MKANRPFAHTVLWLAICGVVGAVGLEIARPDIDNLGAITGLWAFLGSLAAILKTLETGHAVNSRLDAVVAQAEQIGIAKGITQERARADAAKED